MGQGTTGKRERALARCLGQHDTQTPPRPVPDRRRAKLFEAYNPVLLASFLLHEVIVAQNDISALRRRADP